MLIRVPPFNERDAALEEPKSVWTGIKKDPNYDGLDFSDEDDNEYDEDDYESENYYEEEDEDEEDSDSDEGDEEEEGTSGQAVPA